MSKPTLAYLGPEGTFSEFISRARYGESHHLVPVPTVDEIFDFVAADPARVGVVPIENSSGGMIHATVDRLVDAKNTLRILEELSIRVNLALAAQAGADIRRIYSHFAPLHHCDRWIKEHYPQAERVVVNSTAEAARRVLDDAQGAALCTKEAPARYGLQILVYPVQQDMENVTQFYCIGHRQSAGAPSGPRKTSLVVTLPQVPGSLLHFLEPFRDQNLNLTRILSRPIPGKPQEYVFLVDLQGGETDQSIQSALARISRDHLCTGLTVLGSFTVAPTLDS